MKASERNIIMRRLISAYNKLGEAQKQNIENRSERFPMLSQELIRAQAEDDALLSLGWCKLGLRSGGERQYWVHWGRPLTAHQRYFLKDYFDNEAKLQFPLDSSCLCKWLYEEEYFNNID